MIRVRVTPVSAAARFGSQTLEPLERRCLLAATTPPQLLLDSDPSAPIASFSYGGEFNGRAIFASSFSQSQIPYAGTTFWSSDGTPAGTIPIGTITGSILPGDAVVANGNVYFIPSDEFQFDGGIGWMNLQSGGITKRPRFWTLSNPYTPDSIYAVDNDVRYNIFYRYTGGSGHRTISITSSYRTGDVFETEGFTLNGRGVTLTNRATGASAQSNLYEFDHQRDLSPFMLKSNVPRQELIRVHDGLALFVTASSEVWSTDGTIGGTRKVADTEPLAVYQLYGYANGRVLYARQSAGGEPQLWSQAIDVDTTPPARGPSTPLLAPGMDSGASSTDRITNVQRPTIVGAAAPASLVTLFANGDEVGHAIASQDGSYSITPEISLAFRASYGAAGAGAVRLRVSSTEPQGSPTGPSAPLDIVVDTEAPFLRPIYYYPPQLDVTGFRFELFDSQEIDYDGFSRADVVLRNVQTGARVDVRGLDLSFNQTGYDHPHLTIRGSLPFAGKHLAAGHYQLIVSPTNLVDRAGNAAAKPFRFDLSVGGNTQPATATLLDGILWIRGNEQDNDILITRSRSKTDRLVVTIDGWRQAFNIGDVSVVRCDVGAGDDAIIVRETAGTIPAGVSVLGGDGNDTILAGSGDDTLYGQAGRDLLHGSAGRDHLWGGDDDDRLFGGEARDIIHGQLGRDIFDRRDLLTDLRDRQPEESLALA